MKNLMVRNLILNVVVIAFVTPLLASCTTRSTALANEQTPLVEMTAIDLDPKQPERREFGRLTLLSAYELRSKDRRFGGLSGLTIGADGKLYAVSDTGYWITAGMILDSEAKLVDLTDWNTQPLLSTSGAPVRNPLHDAEGLARAPDGSFLVSFEKAHRIWRYPPPPLTSRSLPVPVRVPAEVAKAPSNGGLEGITVLADGRLLTLTEEFKNPDGSFKGWLLEGERFFALSYLPADGFHVTDCAALDNGDVIVLERRYVPLGILSVRLTLVPGLQIQPGAKLRGEELLRLEYPLNVDNFEGVAVQENANKETLIYIVSDNNFSSFQRTLLFQFRLNGSGN
jgi:hypothetical protein